VRRFFVKNLLFVLSVNLLVKPLWIFMIDRTVQNRVGHASYGTYQALFNLGIIFQILLDFGLSYYNTRVISQNPEKLKSIFPGLLSARLVLVAVYAIIVCIIGFAAGYNSSELLLLAGILLIQVFNSFIQFLRSNIAALHRFKADGVLSVTDRLLMIVICGCLLFVPATAALFKIEWFVIAQVISYAIAVVIGFFILKKISKISLSLSLDVKHVTDIIKSGLPYATLIFMMAIHTRADTVLLERLSDDGKVQAGIYAAAYRLLDVGNMFGLMFAGMLLPMFGRMLVQKEDVHPIIKLCVNIMLPVAFMMAIASFYFGNNIMHMLYTSATDADGKVFALLMASFPAYCMMYIYSTLLTANGNLKLLNKIALTGVIINLGLNSILIPRYHAAGAAFTAFITQTTLAICFMVFSGKHVQLPRNSKWIAAHTGFLLMMLVLGYVVTLLPVSWHWQVAAFGLTGVLLLFVFRFISVAAIQKLVNSRQSAGSSR
jgi:O-antigen/teichoic acid export membrane protein